MAKRGVHCVHIGNGILIIMYTVRTQSQQVWSTEGLACSHGRAIDYYIESINTACFIARDVCTDEHQLPVSKTHIAFTMTEGLYHNTIYFQYNYYNIYKQKENIYLSILYFAGVVCVLRSDLSDNGVWSRNVHSQRNFLSWNKQRLSVLLKLECTCTLHETSESTCWA